MTASYRKSAAPQLWQLEDANTRFIRNMSTGTLKRNARLIGLYAGLEESHIREIESGDEEAVEIFRRHLMDEYRKQENHLLRHMLPGER